MRLSIEIRRFRVIEAGGKIYKRHEQDQETDQSNGPSLGAVFRKRKTKTKV